VRVKRHERLFKSGNIPAKTVTHIQPGRTIFLRARFAQGLGHCRSKRQARFKIIVFIEFLHETHGMRSDQFLPGAAKSAALTGIFPA
jgi:hypothetical protein